MLFYNERLSTWEPLIEPVMEKEGVYRPWEVMIKVGRQLYISYLSLIAVVRRWLTGWTLQMFNGYQFYQWGFM